MNIDDRNMKIIFIIFTPNDEADAPGQPAFEKNHGGYSRSASSLLLYIDYFVFYFSCLLIFDTPELGFITNAVDD